MTSKLCRLCLETSAESVNIFEKFQNSTIASILTKHFWFQVDKNDGMSEWMCQICWIQTKTFHHFYKRVEFRHGNYRKTKGMVKFISIKREQSASPKEEESPEPDVDIVKQEETETLTPTTDQLASKEVNYENDEQIDANSCNEESANWRTSDDENQCLDNKTETRDAGEANTAGIQTPPPKIEGKRNKASQSGKEKQNAQIREFCNMKCEICSDVEFETFLKAIKHYRDVHSTSGYLICCGKKYYRRASIIIHVQSHTDPGAYFCDQCGKRFQNKKRLENHIANHVPLDSRAHKCSLCSSSFAKSSLLRAHVKNKHESKTGEKFPCEKCGKNFRSNLLLACHIRVVHEFSLDHVCEVCARQFKSKHLLKSHIFSEHSTAIKAQCNMCGAWLKHEMSLRKHQRRCPESNCKPVSCPICNKMILNKPALYGHISHAHGTKRYQCTFCDKTFKTPKSLREHVACHTGEYLYDCPYCDKKFKSNANMYSHRKKTHLAEWTRDRTTTSKEHNKSNHVEPSDVESTAKPMTVNA